MKRIEWEEAKCPICGITYRYIKGGYRPSTCNKFECLYKYMHRPKLKNEGGDNSKQ